MIEQRQIISNVFMLTWLIMQAWSHIWYDHMILHNILMIILYFNLYFMSKFNFLVNLMYQMSNGN